MSRLTPFQALVLSMVPPIHVGPPRPEFDVESLDTPEPMRVERLDAIDNAEMVREERRRTPAKVWCVQHNDGWCATAGNAEPSEGALRDETACGHVVIMRGGSGHREPTCEDCRRAIGKRRTAACSASSI